MAERRSCLVADDSRVLRAVARRMLEGFGFAVREAGHGAAALGACRAAMPDAALLEWNMPVMDGPGFLRAARAGFGPDRPAVVPCTTESGLERIVEALRAGAQGYVMNPYDEAMLRGELAQAGLFPADGAP